MDAARLTESAKSLIKQLEQWPAPLISVRAISGSSDISTCFEHERNVTLLEMYTLYSLQQPSAQRSPGPTASLRLPPSHCIPSIPPTPSPWYSDTWGANPAPFPHHPKGAVCTTGTSMPSCHSLHLRLPPASMKNCKYTRISRSPEQEKTKDKILASNLKFTATTGWEDIAWDWFPRR